MLFTADIRSLPQKKLKGCFIILLGIFSLVMGFLGIQHHYREVSPCETPRFWISYFQLNFASISSRGSDKYNLYMIRHAGEPPNLRTDSDMLMLRGTPVLFLPGNAGSYRQARTMTMQCSKWIEYDWFSVDFNEDFSAFHGKTVEDQMVYANEAIKFILDLYQGDTNPPKSVLVVGHSMGGIVARGLPLLDNYVEGSVNTILTLSSPHAFAPLSFDRDMIKIYDSVNEWWALNPLNISLISINGGHNDLLVLPDTTLVDSIGGLSLFTHEISGFSSGVDHLAIIWCPKVVETITKSLESIMDHQSPTRTIEASERPKTFRQKFGEGHHLESNASVSDVSSKILWGKTHKFTISTPTNFKFFRRSSLWSYKVKTSSPASIKHFTSNEYRVYGNYSKQTPLVNSSIVMWYSAAPYVPLKDHEDQFNIQIDPTQQSDVQIRVAWRATFANILMHYRSLAASWPFGIVILSTLTLILTLTTTKKPNQKNLFDRALWKTLTNGFVALSCVLTVLHLLLSFSSFRSVAELVQYPLKSVDLKSIESHDLLLGINDFEFVWIIPLLLGTACTLVVIVHYLTVAIIYTRLAIARKILATKIVNQLKKLPKFGLNKLDYNTKIAVFVGLSSFGLMYIPYQITTLMIGLLLLLVLPNDYGFDLAFTELMIWISIVDAPTLLVFAGNLNRHWLVSFSTYQNLTASLPLILYVVLGVPYPTSSPLLVKWSTMFVFGYVSFYSFMYGGLHAYMLHHLTCYFCIWMLSITYRAKNSRNSVAM